MRDFLVLIKTIFLFLFVIAVLILSLPFLLVVSLLRWNAPVHGIAKFLLRLILFFAGVRAEFRGEPLRKAPTLYVANHVSNVDVAVALAYFPTPKAFIAKVEMKKIPILRWWMAQIGCVFLDRGNLRQQVKSLRTAQDRMGDGMSYLVFPEGTRSKTHSLLDFKPGAFRIATKTNTPIQPIGLSGFESVMKKGSIRIYSGKVVVNVGKALFDTEEYDKGSAQLSELMRQEVRRLVEEVEGEGSYPFAEDIAREIAQDSI